MPDPARTPATKAYIEEYQRIWANLETYPPGTLGRAVQRFLWLEVQIRRVGLVAERLRVPSEDWTIPPEWTAPRPK